MNKKRLWIIGLSCVLLLGAVIQIHALVNTAGLPLEGVVIVVDPGHGGKDEGAQKDNVKEAQINLAISQNLKKELEKQGANVILTRDGAYDLASEGARNRKKEDMKKRADIINEDRVDLFLSIHLNAYPNVAVHGGQVFYQKNDAAGKAFADIIQKRLNDFNQTDKKSKIGDYYILNETVHPGILVECGFLSNDKDRSNLSNASYQQEIAKLLCEGVCEYLEVLTI